MARQDANRNQGLKDRRKTKDLKTRVFIILSFAAWVIFFVTLIVFHRAQPEYETVFDRFYSLDIRTEWDFRFLKYLAVSVILGLTVSIFSY